MTVDTLPRTGLKRWGAGTDPFTRAQVNADADAAEALFALDVQDTLANRPGAAKRGRYFYATDTGQVFRDTGSVWIQLPTLGISNTFSAAQSIVVDGAGSQLTVETSSGAGGASGVMVRRRTAADLSAWKRAWVYVDANRASLYAQAETDAGNSYNSDLTGMSGRWALNWGASSAPSDTFVIKNRAGTEIGRFLESGGLGLGVSSPIANLDVRTQAAGAIGLRVGGPVASGHDYAYSLTPLGAADAQHLSGATSVGGTVTARAASATIYEQLNASHKWFWDTGLTAGNTYSPTLRAILDSSFSKSCFYLPRSDSRLGVGVAPASSLHVVTDNEGGPLLDGHQAAIAFRNTGGTPKGLVGIRDDITGNTDDLVFYGYGGSWRFYVSGSEAVRVNNGGVTSLRGGNIGGGSLGTGGPYMSFSEDGGFWSFIWAQKTASLSHLGIGTSGTGSIIAMRPEGYDTLILSRSFGRTYAGAGGYMVAGSSYSIAGTPGFQVRRFELPGVPDNLGGLYQISHDIGSARTILAASAWLRGNSGESVSCPIANIDGVGFAVSIPAGNIGRNVWVGAVIADTDPASWH